MRSFTSELRLIMSDKGESITLLEGFYYYRAPLRLDIMGEKLEHCIIVPKGFRSDGFSNFGAHFFVNKFGRGLKCAILHDYLCEQFHKGKISRKEADEIFLESMLETKAFNPLEARLIYACVRAFALLKGYE